MQIRGYIHFGSTMQKKRYQYAGASTRLLLLCALFLGCSFDESFGLEFNNRNRPDLLTLRVGEEVKKEKLALQEGSSYEYEVRGLQLSKWYEIKISYPASIPGRFDITLVRESMTNLRGSARKLLNTEKLMFRVDNSFPKQMRAGTYYARVIVTVHPEGILSKYQLSDQPFIIYNILCEEVMLGIPKQAWWVGFLATFVLCVCLFVSSRLPPSLLAPKSFNTKSVKEDS